MEEAPTPSFECDIRDIKNISQSFNVKFNNEDYTITIGVLKDVLIIKATSNDQIQHNYQSHYTFEQLKNISKSMRYFDEINDVISFIENKGKKNEIFLKKEQNNLFITFKVTSPNGKEEDILLKLESKELSDKEIISLLLKKVDYLENEIKTLKERLTISDKIISENKMDISKLFSEIELLKKQNNNKNDEVQNNNIMIDSKIANEKDIDFIINYLKGSPIISNKNFKFNLLYRATRDGDDTTNVHRKCCGNKNVILFIKNEAGEKYGGFTHIGWETRNKGNFEYPIDDEAFLFSLNNKKLFKAKKGKNKMCWISSDKNGLCFYATIGFDNNFLTKRKSSISSFYQYENNFINCRKNDLILNENCVFKELEVFKIN